MSTKSFTAKSSGSAKGPSGGNVKSPCNSPADLLKTIGGMPPTKTIAQINEVNTPKSAPGSVMGAGE